MPLVVDEIAAGRSRVIGLRLVLLTLRLMENWKHDVDDYDRAMILVAVAAITAERLLRSGKLDADFESLSDPIPDELLAKCNVSSIASATGLNRETTRRKVDGLVEAGLLARTKEGGLTCGPGVLQQSTTETLVRTQLDTLLRASNDLLRDGVFRFQ